VGSASASERMSRRSVVPRQCEREGGCVVARSASGKGRLTASDATSSFVASSRHTLQHP
jgi:hypothetical protein